MKKMDTLEQIVIMDQIEKTMKRYKIQSIFSKIGFELLLLWTALAYFVYGGLEGTMAIVILCVLYGLATLLALIPFGGAIIQVMVMKFAIWPYVMAFTGITATWLTGLVFWIDVIIGIILTFAATIVVLKSR